MFSLHPGSSVRVKVSAVRTLRRRLACAVASLFLAMSVSAQAKECKCDHCGHEASCQRVCRLVSEERKVSTTCWGYQCDEFCVPGPSKAGCKHCETVCDECKDQDSKVHARPQRLVWSDWNPACFANRFTKAKLMKKTESKKVKSYKWVVEEVCATCVSRCAKIDSPDGDAVIPPLPRNAGHVLAPDSVVEELGIENVPAREHEHGVASRNGEVLK